AYLFDALGSFALLAMAIMAACAGPGRAGPASAVVGAAVTFAGLANLALILSLVGSANLGAPAFSPKQTLGVLAVTAVAAALVAVSLAVSAKARVPMLAGNRPIPARLGLGAANHAGYPPAPH
ncbi:MAG: hypothetical protein LBU05_06710, partial [Bifidobacteriaceae bacterium]|nr:hypothetical protein [Bifidobacteriaceae bacterium]